MPRRRRNSLEEQVEATRESVGQLLERVRGLVAEIATIRMEKRKLQDDCDAARREVLSHYKDQEQEAVSRGWRYLFPGSDVGLARHG